MEKFKKYEGSIAITIILLSLSIISFSLVAFAGDSVKISENEYGHKWPFTLSEGQLSCERGMAIVFYSNGKTYAVNGSAGNQAKKRGWKKIEEIWKDNPQIPGTKMNIGPIIEKGLSLCR